MQWDADEYRHHAAFVAQLANDLVDVLDPKKDECILDIGCGDGCLTEVIAASGAKVWCIDYSEEMAQAARERGIRAITMDAHTMTLKNKLDAIFSNAALHWMQDIDEVLLRCYQSLKPGGRIVAEFGGEGNLTQTRAAITTALKARGLRYEDYHPWYFPNEEEHTRRLQKAGFSVKSISVFPRPTLLPEGIEGWLTIVIQPFIQDIPEHEQQVFFNEVIELLRPHACNEQGEWTIDYVRCRFTAYKDASASSDPAATA